MAFIEKLEARGRPATSWRSSPLTSPTRRSGYAIVVSHYADDKLETLRTPPALEVVVINALARQRLRAFLVSNRKIGARSSSRSNADNMLKSAGTYLALETAVIVY